MTIDVSGILKELGGKIEVRGEVNIGDIEFRGECYSFSEPLTVSGTMANNGKSLVLSADVSGEMGTQCARCLKDIKAAVEFSVEEHFVQSSSGVPEDDETIVFEGHIVEIDTAVRDNLIMNIGGRYLCDEDCKGLCPQCGADLNDGECDCSREYIDPRWSGLADLMKNNN